MLLPVQPRPEGEARNSRCKKYSLGEPFSAARRLSARSCGNQLGNRSRLAMLTWLRHPSRPWSATSRQAPLLRRRCVYADTALPLRSES